MKKSKKLLCSQVKIGSQVKQIVSGIKAHYTPEEMVGKKVMVLVNLKPAKLAGVLSEGMLLCAEDENGESVPDGTGKENAVRSRDLLRGKECMIFDSHAHYDDEAFDTGQRRACCPRWNEQGVGCIVNVGASFRGVQRTAWSCRMRYPHVYACSGRASGSCR